MKYIKKSRRMAIIVLVSRVVGGRETDVRRFPYYLQRYNT